MTLKALYCIIQSKYPQDSIINKLLLKIDSQKKTDKLSKKESELIRDIVFWLYISNDDASILETASIFTSIPITDNKEKWEPIEIALSLIKYLSIKHEQGELRKIIENRINEARDIEQPFIRSITEKVRLRQLEGEHLYFEVIKRARSENNRRSEIVHTLSQLQRLIWIISEGKSVSLTNEWLVQNIDECTIFLSKCTISDISSIYS